MSIENSIGFLSTPYESFPRGLETAYREARKLTARLIMAQPIAVFSPVVYCHQLATAGGGPDPRDRKFWLPFIRPFMEKCAFQWVAHLPNWENSEGIAEESGYFERAHKSIWDLDPIRVTWINRERVKPPRDRYDSASISYEDLEMQKREYLGHSNGGGAP